LQYFSLRMRLCFMKGKSTRAGRAESLDSIPLGVQVYCNPFAAFTTHDSIPLICEHRAYMTIHKFQSFLPPHSPSQEGGRVGAYCVMGTGAPF
jgi:hypothetical protein